MSEFRDFLNQPLEIGDFVVYGTTTGTGRGLYYGEIVKFTPKMVRVKSYGRVWKGTELMYPNDIVKVDAQLVTLKIMSKE